MAAEAARLRHYKRDLLRIEVFLVLLAGVVGVYAVRLLSKADTQVPGATLLAGLLVAVGTFRTIQVNREGQLTERFAKAIGQLGSDSEEVRLGGIYALERIARDSRRDHETAMEVLTAYVRKCTSWASGNEPSNVTGPLT